MDSGILPFSASGGYPSRPEGILRIRARSLLLYSGSAPPTRRKDTLELAASFAKEGAI